MLLRDPKVAAVGEGPCANWPPGHRPQLPPLRRARRDPRLQRQRVPGGTDPFALFERDAAARLDPAHAFYLGYEMAKAVTALTLGKNYTQDQALRLGLPDRAGDRVTNRNSAVYSPGLARGPA